MIEIEEKYMQRAIELAQCGKGLTYPNPMVGAVIVYNGRIIGEGYHIKAGTGHAEVNAVNSVRDKSLLKDSTIYVSLEPCAHYGKTPPCAQLIIDMGIPRVVVGCVDSFSKVSGKGIEMLREAGCEVVVGVNEEECRRLNKRFFTFHEKQRPYIILKWAQTADGYIDIERSSAEPAARISNDKCRRLVHKQRSEEQAILVGGNTIRMDNPSLTTRYWSGKSPVRFVWSSRENISIRAKVLTDGNETHIVRGTTPHEVIGKIYEQGLQSVIVEGGSQTLQSFIDNGLWDEANIYVAPHTLGKGVEAPQGIDLKDAQWEDINGCRLYDIYNE